MGRQQQRKRQQRRQRERQTRKVSQRQQKRSMSGWLAIGAAVVLVVVAALIFALSGKPSGSNAAAGAAATATVVANQVSVAPAVDGIKCQRMEALAYHIHQYLELYDHGRRVQVPSSIGMPGGEAQARCFYWIHVHAMYPDIIHVESPIHKTFTLGNFFDIWKATQADANPPGDGYVKSLQSAAAKGDVTVYVDGKLWTSGYRTVPLREHEVIAVEIGGPVVPPKPFTAWNGL